MAVPSKELDEVGEKRKRRPNPAKVRQAQERLIENAAKAYVLAAARKLTERRVELGWSMEDLAQEAMVSRETVRLIEAGRHAPQLNTLYRVIRALGKTPRDILGEDPGQPERNGYEEPRKIPQIGEQRVLSGTRG